MIGGYQSSPSTMPMTLMADYSIKKEKYKEAIIYERKKIVYLKK